MAYSSSTMNAESFGHTLAFAGPSFQGFASAITANRDLGRRRRHRFRTPTVQVSHLPQLLPLAGPASLRRQSCERVRIVDCWIGVVQKDDRRVVRLAGRLGEAQVPELLASCGCPGPLELDLSDLVSADAAGFDALHRVQARGAVFVGVPGYIRLQLESHSRTRPGRLGGKLY